MIKIRVVTRYELQNNHESISQQFIAYVNSHSDPYEGPHPETLREGLWNVQVKLPLLATTIEKVQFSVHALKDRGVPTGEREYGIDIHMNDDMIVFFSHNPSETNALFTFEWGETPFRYEIQDEDIDRLLVELTDYEVSGQMTKADRQSE